MEEYRDIPGYEGLYSVSNYGKVWSHRRNKLMTPHPCTDYLHVCLYKDKKRKTPKIHKLVAMAFLGHKPDGTHKVVVDHIDNDKLNNHVSNLQLISQRHNVNKDRKPMVRKYDLPTGVTLCGRSKDKYMSRASINGKYVYLGVFDTPEEASAVYQTAIEKNEW